MIRAAFLLAAAALGSTPAQADGFAPWAGAAPASIEALPMDAEVWTAPAMAIALETDAAFGEIAAAPKLSEEAEAAAVQADKARMAQHTLSRVEPQYAGGAVDHRIEVAFGGFTAFGGDGLAYASQDFARAASGGSDTIGVARAPFVDRSLVAFLFPRD